MALINCQECGGQVSSQAAACPACGRPVYIKKKTSPVAVIIIIAAVVAVLIAIGSGSGSHEAKNPVKAQLRLVGSTAISVTNTDNFTWPSVTIWLNGDPMSGYKYVYNREVAPQQMILVNLIDCARDDRRFNPYERKLTQVMVYVDGHDAPIFKVE